MKSQIRNNFDRASTSYDDYASIQKMSSEHLAKMGTDLKLGIKTILDIGCGTGNTSAEFLKIYNSATITLCDISEKMVSSAMQKIPTAEYIVCDAELHDFQNNYDLCISNLSFQWFENLELFLPKIMNQCKYIAFSILVDKSFEEYEITTGHRYHSINWLKEMVKKHGSIITSDYKSYDLHVENAIEAARYFKSIGAHYTRSQSMKNVSILLSHKQKINLNYNVFFVYLSRIGE